MGGIQEGPSQSPNQDPAQAISTATTMTGTIVGSNERGVTFGGGARGSRPTERLPTHQREISQTAQFTRSSGGP